LELRLTFLCFRGRAIAQKQRTHHSELMTSFPEMFELSHGLVHKNAPDNPGMIDDKRETGM